MRRLLIGAVLAVMMSFAFAAVASAQQGPACPGGQVNVERPNGTFICVPPNVEDQTPAQKAAVTNDPRPNAETPIVENQGVPVSPAATTPAATIPPGTARCEGIIDPTEFQQCVAQGGPTPSGGTTTTPAATTPVATTATTAPATTSTMSALPDTGGPIVLLPAAALLIGGGLLAFGISRRK